jgi:hypothetical protein
MGKLSPRKQNILGWLTSIIILVLIFGAGAVAAQALLDPEDAVDNTNQGEVNDPAALEAVSAVTTTSGVLQIFQTTATYNGAGPAGYGRSAMHAACRAQDPESHFCSLQEIETAWKTGGLNIVQVNQAWVDNAVTGTIDSGYGGDFTIVSDWYGGTAVGDHPYNCNAWTNSANVGRGLIMNDGAISPAVEACDDIHPITCCK